MRPPALPDSRVQVKGPAEGLGAPSSRRRATSSASSRASRKASTARRQREDSGVGVGTREGLKTDESLLSSRQRSPRPREESVESGDKRKAGANVPCPTGAERFEALLVDPLPTRGGPTTLLGRRARSASLAGEKSGAPLSLSSSSSDGGLVVGARGGWTDA